jgi:hypothetical protein
MNQRCVSRRFFYHWFEKHITARKMREPSHRHGNLQLSFLRAYTLGFQYCDLKTACPEAYTAASWHATDAFFQEAVTWRIPAI